ncbi:2-hydroxyacid dehydrogenase [Caballeronia sordidicola]|uniref:D-3-phosphoglycerate dehydrogenase n=1 Tax=Caballeronia sordidicola TaxID=196367 RepID=A0A242M771_CABSO|nr:2-hydroxyacid dehydrogenase [Caballeronia sordidicola]OTP66871.1 D-3-phosphoglycerate dehydrogenase [Caballeronia sordidicola]OTP79651.1 D-3-phosphoglycerate dehydrogenase [Caballeronia sordidicola]
MHKTDLLVVVRYPERDMAELERHFTLHVLSDCANRGALLAEVGSRIRALATNGEAGASAELIDALPALEIIVSYGVGVDAIDLAHAAKRGIRVTNTPDVLTGDVADMGIGLMLSIARQIPANDRLVRDAQWGKAAIPLATRMFGKRLGVLGLGRVGRALAKRAAAFDMSIAYHDRVQFDDVGYTYCDSAVALARESDFLVICAAADKQSQGSVSRDVFDALGPDGILVNIARGSIVDEPVLLEYLNERRIRGAALDVFWNEPSIDPRFFTLDNVVLQPHRSSATVETRSAMAQLVRENLKAFFSGAPLVTEFSTR